MNKQRTPGDLTTAEAARLIRVSRDAIQKAIMRGRLPATKAAARTSPYLIRIEDLRTAFPGYVRRPKGPRGPHGFTSPDEARKWIEEATGVDTFVLRDPKDRAEALRRMRER